MLLYSTIFERILVLNHGKHLQISSLNQWTERISDAGIISNISVQSRTFCSNIDHFVLTIGVNVSNLKLRSILQNVCSSFSFTFKASKTHPWINSTNLLASIFFTNVVLLLLISANLPNSRDSSVYALLDLTVSAHRVSVYRNDFSCSVLLWGVPENVIWYFHLNSQRLVCIYNIIVLFKDFVLQANVRSVSKEIEKAIHWWINWKINAPSGVNGIEIALISCTRIEIIHAVHCFKLSQLRFKKSVYQKITFYIYVVIYLLKRCCD